MVWDSKGSASVHAGKGGSVAMKTLLSTKQVAQFLGVNEKMVYTLISEKGLPATKVTGKWRFPSHLVEQWVESQTLNYPEHQTVPQNNHGLLIITGSNDILLDRTISLFNRRYPDHLAVFGNLGSLGGLRALRRGQCHIASSHLLQEDQEEYNFGFAEEELGALPAVVNFSRRRQGLLIAKGNPKKIRSVEDLGRKGLRLANRALGTGTRLLLDRELKRAGIDGDRIEGYHNEFDRHLDVGLEILAGRADAAPGIATVASLLNLDFIPLRWERFDLLISKNRFFEQVVQRFLGILHEKSFSELAREGEGYDLSLSGKMIYPHEAQGK
jgi:putative molybdopterin biosynthesis protein